MLKILQARFQQYVNQELPHVHTGFRKGREASNQIVNIHWIIKKARGFQKNICFIDYAYCGKFLKRWEYQTTLLVSWETYMWVKKQHSWAWNNWLVQNWERVPEGCILPPCLFNFYAEYIMRNAGLDESQTRIKIARRSINNLRYADDITLKAESEEEI